MSRSPQSMSKLVYSELSILMTCSGVAVEQMDVNPTISLNNMVTLSTILGDTISPTRQ